MMMKPTVTENYKLRNLRICFSSETLMRNGKYLPNIPKKSQVLPSLDHPKEDKLKFT